jgi:hypothetical protein
MAAVVFDMCTKCVFGFPLYDKTFQLWSQAGVRVPPCFIVVCNNTSTSKLVYDYISGFHRENAVGTTTLENGRLPLFRNFDQPYISARPWHRKSTPSLAWTSPSISGRLNPDFVVILMCIHPQDALCRSPGFD